MEEKIIVTAKRKKPLSKLAPVLGELGFSKVAYSKKKLVVEKSGGEDLYGKKHLHYRIVFGDKDVEFSYSIPSSSTKRRRMLEIYPVLINTVRIAEDFYEIKASTLLEPVLYLLKEMDAVVGRDALDVSSELDALNEKHQTLTKKYEELVRSSEENARILLESERRREELNKRNEELESLSDETLREELFKWLKVHNGSINIREFSKAYGAQSKRVEEGLNQLIKEGYIKKRSL
jgi:hypothetical protein